MYAFIQNIRNVRSTLKRRDFNVKPRRDNGEILSLKQRRSVNVAVCQRSLKKLRTLKKKKIFQSALTWSQIERTLKTFFKVCNYSESVVT